MSTVHTNNSGGGNHEHPGDGNAEVFPGDGRVAALVQLAAEADEFERLVEAQAEQPRTAGSLIAAVGIAHASTGRGSAKNWLRWGGGIAAAAAVVLGATVGLGVWKQKPTGGVVVVSGGSREIVTAVRGERVVTEEEVEAARREMLALKKSMANEPRGKFAAATQTASRAAAKSAGFVAENAGDLAEGLAMMLAVFRESTTGVECVNLRSLGNGRTLADLSGEELIDVAFAEPCMDNADSVVVYAMAGSAETIPTDAHEAAELASCIRNQGGTDARACGGSEALHVERAGNCLPENVMTRAAGW